MPSLQLRYWLWSDHLWSAHRPHRIVIAGGLAAQDRSVARGPGCRLRGSDDGPGPAVAVPGGKAVLPLHFRFPRTSAALLLSKTAPFFAVSPFYALCLFSRLCIFQALVDDAVAKGATLLCGGFLPSKVAGSKRSDAAQRMAASTPRLSLTSHGRCTALSLPFHCPVTAFQLPLYCLS